MKRLMYFTVLLSGFFFFMVACKEQENADSGKESKATVFCTTGDADEITINSATLKGTAFFADAQAPLGEACFYCSTNGDNVDVVVTTGTKVDAGTVPSDGGAFSAVVSNLNPATTYYFVAVASIDGKEATGSIGSFTTLSRPAEIIVTAEADGITANSARLYGYANLERVEGNAIFGIIISTNESPNQDNGATIQSYEIDRNNKYYVEVDQLYPLSTYYYKAFIKDGNILRVGEVKNFTTDYYHVQEIRIDPSSISIVVSKTAQLLYELWPENATYREVSWTSKNPSIATINEHGLVTAVSEGEATIVATSKDEGKTAECKVTVTPWIHPTSVTLDKTEIDIAPGYRSTLIATVYPEKATDKTITWSSDNTSTVTVSNTGVINAISEGVANVIATTNDGGIQAKCVVTVDNNAAPVAGGSAVDLGLSVYWSDVNLGAETPGELGDYYAWGEIGPKDEYDFDNYQWYRNGNWKDVSKYCISWGYGTVDNKTVLEPEDDAATMNWGVNWRTPTADEFKELQNGCNIQYTSSGWKFTSKKNGNYIFLPKGGYYDSSGLKDINELRYWSSSLSDTELSYNAIALYSSTTGSFLLYRYSTRNEGYQIRPVMVK